MKEQREAFDRLLQLGEDYQAAKLALSSAQRAAEAIRAVVAERIEADRAQTGERVAELEHMVEDESRPTSARRVWEMELDQLKARTFGATTGEIGAFDAEMSAAQEAVEDLNRLQREIREAIQTVNGAITELRAKTVGDSCSGLWSSWLESDRKAFAPLCREVGA